MSPGPVVLSSRNSFVSTKVGSDPPPFLSTHFLLKHPPDTPELIKVRVGSAETQRRPWVGKPRPGDGRGSGARPRFLSSALTRRQQSEPWCKRCKANVVAVTQRQRQGGENSGGAVMLKLPGHVETLRITKRDEFGDKTDKVEMNKMIAIIIIMTMYYVFSSLPPHHYLWGLSWFPCLKWESCSPRKLCDFAKVTQLTGAWNLNFKPVLLITALCCLSGETGVAVKGTRWTPGERVTLTLGVLREYFCCSVEPSKFSRPPWGMSFQ